MAQIKSEERIPARMPSEVYEKIVEAARLTGATLNQFLVQAALEKADNVLERERVIHLSRKAADMVFHLLDHPPEPNEIMKKAAARRKQELPSHPSDF